LGCSSSSTSSFFSSVRYFNTSPDDPTFLTLHYQFTRNLSGSIAVFVTEENADVCIYLWLVGKSLFRLANFQLTR
jgi:hypothetical protein